MSASSEGFISHSPYRSGGRRDLVPLRNSKDGALQGSGLSKLACLNLLSTTWGYAVQGRFFAWTADVVGAISVEGGREAPVGWSCARELCGWELVSVGLTTGCDDIAGTWGTISVWPETFSPMVGRNLSGRARRTRSWSRWRKKRLRKLLDWLMR